MLKQFLLFSLFFSFQCFAQEGEDFLEMDQKDLAELEKVKQVQQKHYQNIADPIAEPLNKLQELGHETLTIKSLMDTKVIEALQEVIEKGGLDRIDPNSIRENISKSSLAPLAEKFPNVFSAMIKVGKDKNSVSHLLKLFEEKDHAKDYGMIVIAGFVLFIFLRTRIVKPTWGFMKRLFWNSAFNLSYMMMSLGFMYYWFYENLSPAVNTFIQAL